MSIKLSLYGRMLSTVNRDVRGCNTTKDKDKDLTDKEKDEFMEIVQDLDSQGRELVAALCRAHQIESGEKVDASPPYQGVSAGDDLSFDLEMLPICLRHILYNFVRMHKRSSSEDHAMVSARTP